jgi:hypothetical protein
MDRAIYATRRFAGTWKGLDPRLKNRVIETIVALPSLIIDPHCHSGYGIRQLHGSPFWEARLDLRWRLVFRLDHQEIILFDVMNHDQVRRL